MRVLIPISTDPCAIGMQREPRCSCNSSNTCYPYYGEATKAAVWNRCRNGRGGWTLHSEARRSPGDSCVRSLSFAERTKTHCGESSCHDVTKGTCTEPSTSSVRHPLMGHLVPNKGLITFCLSIQLHKAAKLWSWIKNKNFKWVYVALLCISHWYDKNVIHLSAFY